MSNGRKDKSLLHLILPHRYVQILSAGECIPRRGPLLIFVSGPSSPANKRRMSSGMKIYSRVFSHLFRTLRQPYDHGYSQAT